MSNLFKKSITLLMVLTLVFALALPTVALAEGTPDEDLTEDDTIIEEEGDDIIEDDIIEDDIIEDDVDVPQTGDSTASALLFGGMAVVIVAGALAFTMKRARD